MKHKHTVRLFKAVEVSDKTRTRPVPEDITLETVKRGFVFSHIVAGNSTDAELRELVKVVEAEVGLTPEKMNAAFHKSWGKVKDAPMLQLVMEQLVHYMTTYGFERMGIYNEDSVFVPNERLEIPEDKGGMSLVVIKAMTKAELRDKLLSLLSSGVALAKDTITDAMHVAFQVEFTDIDTVKNKEVRVLMYDFLNIVPKYPSEFMRYLIWTVTDKTLLIKNDETVAKIKASQNFKVLGMFKMYERKYGLEPLASIFYRYKPLFLAFRKNTSLRPTINRIRKLAKKHHEPMPEDYLNSLTAKIKRGERILLPQLQSELSKVNTFRKIRLAYALKYRMVGPASILYRIRNGKGFASDFSFENKLGAAYTFDVVYDHIIKDIRKNVEGKKVFIPSNFVYALPATEKMFVGNFPSGSCIKMESNMVFGIYWTNVDEHRIDIDLSLMNAYRKVGWDSRHRTYGGAILFSGDLTSAPLPNGASELFYIKYQPTEEDVNILFANYFNFSPAVPVPFKIVVGQDELDTLDRDYTLDPNKVLAVVSSKLEREQKMLGISITTPTDCRFYFAESDIGRGRSSRVNKAAEHARNYMISFYRNTISLNAVLEMAGAVFVEKAEEADIDLSFEAVDKTTIIDLLR